MASSRLARRKAFTLLEILVVITIIAVLFALIMVGVYKVRQSADKAATVNHLYQLGVALQHYHIVNKKFPTEDGASATSFYQALLPHLEQQNAQPTTPIKVFLSPARRGIEVGPKRDFGYASSFAQGAVGPSVLDSPNGVSKGDISTGGKGIAETALLSMVWMAPSTYPGGDATDAGWAQKMNSRSNLMAIKQDKDGTGNNTFLGGPFEGGVPTLFADNHIAVVPYSTSQTDWATSWAYNTSMHRDCNAWVPPDPTGKKTCSGCGAACRCGCVGGGSLFADGGNSYTQEDILNYLKDKAKNGTLTKEEEELLKRLSRSDYDKYRNRLNQERSNWEKYVREKAQRGEQLTEEEQKYYDRYITEQKNRLQREERSRWEQSVRDKAARGEQLTQEEQKYYDQYKASQEAAAKRQQEQQKRLQWEQSVRDKAKNGETLTKEEKAYYDRYTQEQETRRIREWQNQTIQKAKSGQTLTQEEQNFYNQYQQQQQQYQQQYQQDLQNRLNNYVNNLTGGGSGSGSDNGRPGGPCSCGFTCCQHGKCKCAH